MLPDPDAQLVLVLQALLSCLPWGCTGTRGEAYPLTPFGSNILPDVFYHPWGLASGYMAQTAPVVVGDKAASSMASHCAVAAAAGVGSSGTRGGGARTNSGCPKIAVICWNPDGAGCTRTVWSSGCSIGSRAVGYGRPSM